MTAAQVLAKTGNTLGLPGGGSHVTVYVDRNQMLPADCPPADIAMLIHKGMVEVVDGIDPEVAGQLALIEAAHVRPAVPELTARERLAEASWRAGLRAGEPLSEWLAAVEALVDERVERALWEVRADA